MGWRLTLRMVCAISLISGGVNIAEQQRINRPRDTMQNAVLMGRMMAGEIPNDKHLYLKPDDPPLIDILREAEKRRSVKPKDIA